MSFDHLFRNLCCSGYVMMASFSCKQSMHLFVVLLYAGACFRIDHDILPNNVISFYSIQALP